MKISIKKLEKNLGYKIKKNIYSLGVDTASTTGIAIVKVNTKIVDINTSIIKIPSIPRKIKDQLEKAEKYELAMNGLLNSIRNFTKNLRVPKKSILILEQSFLKNNPSTFGFLRCCQGIFYSELCDSFPIIKIWFPTTVRKMVGFKSSLPRGTKSKDKKKEIMKFISNIIEEEITDDNIADALMLCFAVLKEK